MTLRTVGTRELETKLTGFDDARRIVAEVFTPLTPILLALLDADGLVVAEDVRAGVDVPPFDNSAMDGFAVRSGDCRVGEPLTFVAKIATGMPLPVGADAVVPWESVDSGVLVSPVKSGDFVRARGHDISAGSLLVPRSTPLDAVALATIASTGIGSVMAYPRPRVAVLITGDELAEPGQSLDSAEVYDSNSTLLTLLLRDLGADVIRERQPDDLQAISDSLQRLASECDVIVTTGGASVGERDWVRTAIERDGEMHLWRVAVRPGKPFGMGRIVNTPVLMLPGNPGSVLACTNGFVAPALRRLAGRAAAPSIRTLALATDVANLSDRTFLCPVRIDEDLAHPLVGSTSQGLSHARGLDGWVVVSPNVKLSGGDAVMVELCGIGSSG